jgi:methionyl-tRNA formyltransferase
LITSASRVAAWARARELPSLELGSDYGLELARLPFDHLFAITHLALLPERILRLPARGAVNFHDGPLPRYAGLNAPAWALIHGEARHGVSWHVMTPELDGGPLLKERSFELAADETSFSLNTKCFAAGLDSFTELVAELSAGTSARRRRTRVSAGRSSAIGVRPRPARSTGTRPRTRARRWCAPSTSAGTRTASARPRSSAHGAACS